MAGPGGRAAGGPGERRAAREQLGCAPGVGPGKRTSVMGDQMVRRRGRQIRLVRPNGATKCSTKCATQSPTKSSTKCLDKMVDKMFDKMFDQMLDEMVYKMVYTNVRNVQQ